MPQTFPSKVAQLGMDGNLAKALQDNLATSTNTAVVAITPLTGAFGTPGNAIVDVTATPTQTTINNNFRAIEDKLNALIAALKT